jgi:hypothetical protein
MGWTKGDPGFDLLAPAGARASQEGLHMGRRFGLGDIVTIVGIVIYFSFLIVYFAKYVSDGFDFVAFGQIILILLVGMPITVMILSFKNERYLNLQYAFTGFIVLLKLSQVSVLVERTGGLDFYIILGALAIGVGAYLSQVGIGEMRLAAAEGGAAPGAVTVEDRLRELTRLKDAGLITAEEHAKKREEILGDLP